MQQILHYKTIKCLQRECDPMRGITDPSCPFYHNISEKRRPPFQITQTLQDEDDGSQFYEEIGSTGKNQFKLLYQDYLDPVILRDSSVKLNESDRPYCCNSNEFYYHPYNFKRKQCLDEKFDGKCENRRYCPHWHENEPLRVVRDIQDKIKKNSVGIRGTEKVKLRKKASEPVEIIKAQKEVEEIKVETEFIDQNITIVQKLGDLERRIESFEFVNPPAFILEAGDIESRNQNVKSPQLSRQESESIVDYFKNQGQGKRTRERYQYKTEIDLIEDNTHEFKMINLNNLESFRHLVERYIGAFLNTNGGSIYFGIADNGVILGHRLFRKQIDQLKLEIDTLMSKFTPALVKNEVQLKAVPCVNYKNKIINNTFIVEVHVSKGEEGKVYCTQQNHVYIRRNASCFKLQDARSIIEFVQSKKK